MGFQPSASPVMDQIENFHSELLYIITAVSLFVLALLVWIMHQVPRQREPDPVQGASQHAAGSGLDPHPGDHPGGDRDPVLQAALLRSGHPHPRCALSSAIGKQWFWTYEYPGANAGFTYDTLGLSDADAAKAGRAAPAGRRQYRRGAGQQGGRDRNHRRRRDP